MKFGLSEATIDRLLDLLANYPKISTVKIYGSRAMGNFRPGSDVDLTVMGQGIKLNDILRLENDIDDLLLPYKFDISIYDRIEDTGLRDHIDRKGRTFYRQDANPGVTKETG